MKLNSNRSLHEKFEELAALAVIGELNAFQMQSLREHLAECHDCRQAYEAFADVTSNDLGVAATDPDDVELSAESDADCPNTQESLQSFRGRLVRRHSQVRQLQEQARAQSLSSPVQETSPRAFPLRRVLYGLAAAALLAVSVAAGTGWLRSARAISA
jgi:hypothetical protein